MVKINSFVLGLRVLGLSFLGLHFLGLLESGNGLSGIEARTSLTYARSIPARSLAVSSNTQQQKRTFPFNEVLCSLINCGKLFLWNISRTGYIICFKRTFVNSVEVSIVVSDVEYC